MNHDSRIRRSSERAARQLLLGLINGAFYALLSLGLAIIFGQMGVINMAHGEFMTIGAYTIFLLSSLTESYAPGLLQAYFPFAIVCAFLVAFAFGWLAIRRTGIYFSMITLALSQMVYFAALRAPFTHGEDGLQGVPRGHLFGFIDLNVATNMYYFVLAVFVIGLVVIWRFVNSPFGMILKSIRENEARATSLGYSVAHYKLGAFVMSAALAGLAGG
ncbi:MAG: branched-chain amino acid ABC transporter permease, partial [Gammaproteobacteria bacterium]